MKTTIALFIFNLLNLVKHCSSQTCLTSPPEYAWSISTNGDKSATMTFDAKHFTANEYGFPTGFTTRVHDQLLPSATLRLKRGETYEITLINYLEPVLNTPNNPTEHNVIKDVNVTNLHTHGIHIGGETPADDVFDLIDGGGIFGNSITYHYEIPCDHAGGTFWYHPHHHGSTAIQVGGGAVGAIIIEDDAVAENLPEWLTNMNELILMIQHMDLDEVANIGQGVDDLFMIDEPVSAGDFWLLNGKYKPDICLTAGEWKRIRIVHADIAESNEFSIDNIIEDSTQQCEIYLISRDGVLIHGSDNTVPRYISSRKLYFTTASRADIAIRCNSPSRHVITTDDMEIIGFIEVFQAPGDVNNVALTSFQPIRPAYLQSLLNNPGPFETQTVAITRVVEGTDAHFVINNERFAGDPSDGQGTYLKQMQLGSFQEWTFRGGAHPIHIHINHFQVIENGQTGSDFNWTQIGDWIDVLDTQGKVRFHTDRFGGKVVIHCHILEHEDQGTMRVAYINGGCVTTNCPQNCVQNPTTNQPTTSTTPQTCVPRGELCMIDEDCCQFPERRVPLRCVVSLFGEKICRPIELE